MKLWPLRRRPPQVTPARPRPNPTHIAVLEHDLLGIAPQPGTAAAVTIALRKVSVCLEHNPVDISTFGQGPDTVALCTRCGNHLTRDDTGTWRTASA